MLAQQILLLKKDSNHKRDFKHQKYSNSTEYKCRIRSQIRVGIEGENIAPIINREMLNEVYDDIKQSIGILCLTKRPGVILYTIIVASMKNMS